MFPFTYKEKFILANTCSDRQYELHLLTFIYLCLAKFLRATPYISKEHSVCEGMQPSLGFAQN